MQRLSVMLIVSSALNACDGEAPSEAPREPVGTTPVVATPSSEVPLVLPTDSPFTKIELAEAEKILRAPTGLDGFEGWTRPGGVDFVVSGRGCSPHTNLEDALDAIARGLSGSWVFGDADDPGESSVTRSASSGPYRLDVRADATRCDSTTGDGIEVLLSLRKLRSR